MPSADQLLAQAHDLLAKGNPQQAEILLQQLLQVSPQHPVALHFLALIAFQTGRFAQADELFEQSIAHPSAPPEFFFNFATAKHQRGDFLRACELYHRALDVRPDYPDALSNLAAALAAMHRFDEGAAFAQRALVLKPGWSNAQFNLAQCLTGRAMEHHFSRAHSQATFLYRQALELSPDDVVALTGVALVLADQQQLADAMEMAQRAVNAHPSCPRAHWALGYCLDRSRKREDADNAFSRALQLTPDYAANDPQPPPSPNLQQLDVAIQWCRDAVDMNPANITALVSVAAALARDPDSADDAAGAFVKVLQTHPHLHSPAWALSNRVLSLHYRDDISAATLAREHLRLGRLYEAAHPPRDHRHIDRSLDRPLRIGYVSADFWTHSVMFFLEPILANHDGAHFEIFCYSNGVRADATTARLQSYPLHWRTIAGLPDHHVDDLIARDRIDILVDLTGHTAGSRLTVFAQKPAPIQVSYLGYPSTTGLTRIDYRLSDAVADPPGAESLHSERLIRLKTAWCYRPYPAAPPVSPPPALRNGYITFGCFNNLQKLTAQAAGQWAKLLGALPTSRLLVKSAGLAESQSHHLKLLCDRGIPLERIDLLPRTTTIEEHLGTYASVDIALDTFPYNGTTTTCEALWMGVPVLTIAGGTHHFRVGASLLTTIGFSDWICSMSDFVTKATAATDLLKLAQLRQTLRARVSQSRLLDGLRFTRELEDVYREMWHEFPAR